jgi:hypothetical protein
VLSIEDAAVSPGGFGSHHQSFPTSPLRIPLSSSAGPVSLLPNTLTIDALADTNIDVHLHSFVDEVYIDDSDVGVSERKCRVCATGDLTDNNGDCKYHSCAYCEYDLCMDCSTVYCRESHPLRIWTMPDAVSLSCDMCKKMGITSGYRCLECNTDICDLCTTKDCRNAFMFWPRREINKLLVEFNEMRADSDVVNDYFTRQVQQLSTTAGRKAANLESMSKLCKKLSELNELKYKVAAELRDKKARAEARRYGVHNNDL